MISKECVACARKTMHALGPYVLEAEKQKMRASFHSSECDKWKARAEEAERERDRALADAACAHAVSRGHGVQVDALEKDRDEWKARAEKAERERDRALAEAACAHLFGHGVQVDALEKDRDEWKARADDWRVLWQRAEEVEREWNELRKDRDKWKARAERLAAGRGRE
jgi:hypothetical protein